MNWKLDFISEKDFKEHVRLTINEYKDNLKSYNSQKFNRNLIDPIKMIFDKSVYDCTWSEIVKNEIYRQRDKSNNNAIGYFHQKIFNYMAHCTVPKAGWDVIFKPPGGVIVADGDKVSTIYVEMKNKHNTMNSASSGKTYIKMQGQLLDDDDCACLLVEAIAKASQNIKWTVTVDKKKQSHKHIRRVSMDEFYRIVTGQEDAFYQMCMVLPEVINSVIQEADNINVPHDTVYDELSTVAEANNNSFILAMYLLGFNTYHGFKE